MIVVVRYFGGTLLGVPGLIQAYKTAVSLVLQLTPVIQKTILTSYHLLFDYTMMNDIMIIIKQYKCIIEKQETSLFCSMQIGIPKTYITEAIQRLQEMQGIEIKKL